MVLPIPEVLLHLSRMQVVNCENQLLVDLSQPCYFLRAIENIFGFLGHFRWKLGEVYEGIVEVAFLVGRVNFTFIRCEHVFVNTEQ